MAGPCSPFPLCYLDKMVEFSMFYVSISTTACLYAIYLLKFLVQLYPSCRSSCQPRVSRVTSLTTTVSPGLVTAKSLSQFFNFLFACVYTMPAPVLNGTLWLQTSPVFGLPLVERRPHYLVPGVCSGRGVSATRFPETPPPSERKLG